MFKKKIKGKRVLLVEDDALLLKVLGEAFVADGFEIATVENGLEVEEAVAKFNPDLILLDLIIPGLDGFAVLKNLKADKATEGIPVIILSNLENVGDIKSGKALGAEEYFIKANIELGKVVSVVKDKLGI